MILAAYFWLTLSGMLSVNGAQCQMPLTDAVPVDFRSYGNMDCENAPSEVLIDGKHCNRIGFWHYVNGDYAHAIGCYQKAIALSPEYPVPHNNLGVVYLKLSQLELARECFSRAIVMNPGYIKAICNLAVASYRLGDLDSARQLYYKAKGIDSAYVNQRIDAYIQLHRTRDKQYPDR